jgi:tetratricopeptide (TPR) repeat protein
MDWLKKILGTKESGSAPPVAPAIPAPAPLRPAETPPAAPSESRAETRARAPRPKGGQTTKARRKETQVDAKADAKAFFVRAMSRKDRGKFDEAVDDLTKVLQLNPKVAQAHFERGGIHQRQGNLDLAIADYTKAIELKPDYVEAYSNRGVLRERKGDTSGAKADYSKSIEIELKAALQKQYPEYNPHPPPA